METQRASQIVNNKEICDVFYKNHVVWIQELNNNSAKIGFMDNTTEKIVDIIDLYE